MNVVVVIPLYLQLICLEALYLLGFRASPELRAEGLTAYRGACLVPNRDGVLRKLAAFFLQLRTGYKLGKA